MFTSDEEALDAIKAWWRDNGAWVVAGLAIGIAVVAGWRFWEASQERSAQEASALYEQIRTQAALQDREQLREIAAQLRDDYGRTAYAAQGALRYAAVAVETGELEEAIEWLRWAKDNSRDEELGKLATVRLARVHLALDDPESALNTLDARDLGRFAALAEEVRGDALYATNDRDGAREAYRRAMDAHEDDDDAPPRPELEMKYYELADSEE